jgi:hypothetical protein
MQGVDSTTRPVMAPISISTAGDNVIVSGNPSQYIYVRQILLTTPGGAQTIEFKEGPSTVLSNFELNANDGIIVENTSFDYPFLFDCKPGQDFIINLSAGTSVIGHIVYGFRK